MADVRSMLRAERESRRLTHPHATYTTSGNLICNICDVPIKSERAWGAHLHSTSHNVKLGKQRDDARAKTNEEVLPSKKRKAEDSDSEDIETKRLKQVSERQVEDSSDAEAEVTVLVHDEDEEDVEAAQFAALQQRLALLEQETLQEQRITRTALNAPATIEAAPTSAEELAAKAREEQSRQRSRRDDEIEAEKEDAARALEDEFDEMDSLQERVQKLRERREALRRVNETDTTELPSIKLQNSTIDRGIPDRTLSVDSDGQSSDEEDDHDDWTFGAR